MSTYIRPTVDYSTFPDTDDEPMADTEDNQALMIDTIFALRHRLEPDGHHVGGNLLVYYNRVSVLDHLSPDMFVALGSGPERRKKWETWVEGKFPELIIEFASPSTSDRDVGEKIDLYGRLGAEEYYIFDPIPLLQPPFQAYRRSGWRLVPQAVGPEQRIASPVTGLIFGILDGWLRVIDPATGLPLRIPDEERAARSPRSGDGRRPSGRRAALRNTPGVRNRDGWRPRHVSRRWKRNCAPSGGGKTRVVRAVPGRSCLARGVSGQGWTCGCAAAHGYHGRRSTPGTGRCGCRSLRPVDTLRASCARARDA